jgi:hypothetical protein
MGCIGALLEEEATSYTLAGRRKSGTRLEGLGVGSGRCGSVGVLSSRE